MQEIKIKMKHLMQVLKTLKLNSVQDLLTYLNDCSIYEKKEFHTLSQELKNEYLKTKNYEDFELVNVLVKSNDINCMDFTIACIMATENITEDEAYSKISNNHELYKLFFDYQNKIVELQTITKDPADPNDKATN